MKILRAIAVVVLLAFIATVAYAAQKNQTFTGEITDSGCATMGSHAGMGMPPKECTLACVKRGAKFVLFDAGAKTVYQLDDQKKTAEFAGLKVAVTGTLDSGTKTIHVTAMKAAQ
jgi:type 1 fimbria pilin